MPVRSDFRARRIGVLMGGLSAERAISLKTGAGIERALGERGYDVVGIDWSEGRDLAAALRSERVEVVWNALHGTYGEDGCVQGLLESLRIPYTGSAVAASAVAMDKVLSKKIFEKEGIPTPRWRQVSTAPEAAAVAREFGYPVVVKPSREGSTVGVSIVRDEGALQAALETAGRCHGVTVMEEYVPGKEISVAVLDDEVLGTVEIRARDGFYDYNAKYERGDTEYVVPAPLPPVADREARREALRAHLSLGCAAHNRVDARVSPEGRTYVLEVNTLPGMTERSLLPKIAAHAGIDYATLVERILATAALHA